MQKVIKYVIFQTKWGYFSLAGTEYGLLRTYLPAPKPEKIKSLILKNLLAPNQNTSIKHRVSSIEYRESSIEYRESSIEFDKTFFKPLQEQITTYFEGAYVNFRPDIPINLDGFSSFCRSVLRACRRIRFGQTVTYSALAKKIGRSTAVRAVGNALSRNPLPLIIPCHRVIRSDGKIGGFSAPGGKKLKEKLLNHELAALTCSKDCLYPE